MAKEEQLREKAALRETRDAGAAARAQERLENASFLASAAGYLAASGKRSKVKVKILASFAQVTANLGFVTGVTLPPLFVGFTSPLGLVNLNVLPSLGLGCALAGFDYVDSLLLATLLPLAVALALGAAFQYLRLAHAHAHPQPQEAHLDAYKVAPAVGIAF